MTSSALPRLVPLATAAVVAAGLFFTALAQGAYDVVDRQTAGIVVWWAVGLGALVASPPRRPALPGVLATGFAAAIALWIAVNLGSSLSAERSVNELARAVTHLGPLLLIGWVLPRRLWPAVVGGLVVAAVAICAAALGQRLSPGFLGQSNAVVFLNTTTRLGSPLGYWNAVGSWAAVTSVLLLAISAHAPQRWLRALALSAVPLATTVGYLTYSRSAIGALVLGLGVVVALSLNRWTIVLHIAGAAVAGAVCVVTVRGADAVADATGTAGAGGVLLAVILSGLVLSAVGVATGVLGADRLRMPRRAATIALAVCTVLVLVAGGLAADRYGSKAWDQFSHPVEEDTSDPTARLGSLNGTRIAQWRGAIDTWEAHKVRGTGAGTFELTWNQQAKNEEFVRDAHSAFLETMSEQGTVGLLLLVGFVLSIVATVVLAARRAASAMHRGLVAGAGAGLAAFLLGTAVDWMWEVTALALVAMTLLACLIAASSPDREPSRGAAGLAARGVVLAIAIVAVLVELPGLVGMSEIRKSERALAAGQIDEARAHADQAIDIMYWASSPYVQRGLVDERAGAWDASRTSLELAMDRDPRDWRIPLVLARVEARAGEPEQALEAYRQAKELRPNGRFFK